jgi:hypothetical protein
MPPDLGRHLEHDELIRPGGEPALTPELAELAGNRHQCISCGLIGQVIELGAEGPRYRYGAKILGALLDLLTAVEDTAMSDQELLALLKDIRARAVMKSAPNSKLRRAYAVRMVTDTPSDVW